MMNQNLCRVAATLAWVFLLSLPFGIPEKMQLITRDSGVDGGCMLSDKEVRSIVNPLENLKPELVLVGNSMLGEAVGQEELSSMTTMRTAKVWLGGSSSAWWYLVVKNIFPKLSHKPRYVGIFFRDNYLTLPQYRVTGRRKGAIDNFAGADEEILDKLAYYNSMTQLELYMHRYWPLVNKATALREQFESGIMGVAGSLLGMENASEVRRMLKASFDNDKMDPAKLHARQLADEAAQDAYEKSIHFDPDHSFLKYIVESCEEQGISLFFVRVKRLRDLDPGKQDQELKSYMFQLRNYLSERNIPLIDFTEDGRIKKEHYGRGDHLNRGQGRTLFTRLLADEILLNIVEPKRKLVSNQI